MTPDYASVNNGFSVTIPKMVNGEVLVIRYSAAVDNDKITGLGTVEQTSNKATVRSNEVPDEKEAKADLSGKMDFHKLSKQKAGDTVSLGNNHYEVPWTVQINQDHKLTIGGKTIIDYVRTNSQSFMQFTGDGITMVVTFENGSSETRTIPWANLRTTSNSKGIIRWEYDAPESDGKASYRISYKTFVDTTGVPSTSLTVYNRVMIGDNSTDSSVTIGVIGNDRLTINKEAIRSTSGESEWQIKVHVIKEGYPNLRVIDDLPKLLLGGTYYFDELVEDSIRIEGLLPGESWKLTKIYYSGGRTIHIDFYQDEAQTLTGLKPTANGQPRDIVITLKSMVNQDWLAIAAQNGYTSNHLHTNTASATVSGYIVGDSAVVFPKIRTFRKQFVESGSVVIDGVTYPVYRYVLTLGFPGEDTASISDTFETAFLKYYTGEPVQIFGGTESEQNNSNGEVSASDTADGINIQVSRFPKDADGKFYPVYKVYYSLIVKDRDALDALNNAALQNPDGYTLQNTAQWDDLLSDTVDAVHTYYPYVDKELLSRPTAENGQIAEFKVIINQNADDLDPASDTLDIQDVLSSNLRFIPDSLSISPAVGSIQATHDSATNTLSFTDVPDEMRVEITYRARVLGTGNITYSNTVKLGQYEKTIEDSVEIESSGGGTGSNPSITLIKRDKEALSYILAGATFQLYYMENGNRIPVRDKDNQNVTFTTGADGSFLIIGNQEILGWTLWIDRTYCLVETVAPEGFELSAEPIYFILSENPSSQTEYDITGDILNVQNDPVKISISVTKKWVGPAGTEAVIHLLADGHDTGKSVILNAASNWTATFDGLRKISPDGIEIVYTVAEDPIENYQSVLTGNSETGYTVTNTNTEKISIPVAKTWVGPSADSVTIRLMNGDTEVASQVLNAGNNWQHTFANLPKYDSTDGHEIMYEVREDSVPGYEQGLSGTIGTGFTFTNTITGKVSIPVTKTWVGPAAESVTVELLADGNKVAEAVLNNVNGWQYTFTDFDKYNSGVEIVYTIREINIVGYSSEITGNMSDGFAIKNTNTEKVNIPVEKRWVGTAAENATIRLYADGVKIADIVLTRLNDWKHTFADLPKYDSSDGHEIVYTISEDSVAGYTTSITGDIRTGFVVTNTKTTTDTHSNTPKTGDDSHMLFYFIAMIISGVGLIGTLLFIKKRSRR